MSESFLLSAFDRFTALWVNRFSLASIPPLRRSSQLLTFQHNRDIFILTMLSLAVLMVIPFHFLGKDDHQMLRRCLTAAALYRCMDIFITLVRTGVFLNFRGDVQLREEPAWRVQRILLGVLFNYIELVILFTIIYRQISLQAPCEFVERIEHLHQAFNLSFSTMTTIGYGRYGPDGMVADCLTFFQVVIGIVLLVLVVGSVLALLTGGSPARTNAATPAPATTTAAPLSSEVSAWLSPLSTFLICWISLVLLLGVPRCVAPQSKSTAPAGKASPTPGAAIRSVARPSSA